MAQTTSHMTGVNCPVELTVNDGTSWTNISGSAVRVEVQEQSRTRGSSPTLEGDTHVLGVGKREPHDIIINALYTTSSTEAHALLRAAYENSTAVQVRWSPEGGLSGDQRFTAAGYVTGYTYPSALSDDANPLPVRAVIFTAGIEESTI